MREELKQLIRNYLNVNGFDVSKADNLIDEYESKQTFTELKDGSFEMVTGNTYEQVSEWLHKKGVNQQETEIYLDTEQKENKNNLWVIIARRFYY